MLIGFVIWAIAFIALYALQALGCIWGWPEAMHRTMLVSIWIVGLGLLGAILLWQWRQPADAHPTLRYAPILSTLAAMAASVATYFPVTFATLCL